jgi:hypothetical protein
LTRSGMWKHIDSQTRLQPKVSATMRKWIGTCGQRRGMQVPDRHTFFFLDWRWQRRDNDKSATCHTHTVQSWFAASARTRTVAWKWVPCLAGTRQVITAGITFAISAPEAGSKKDTSSSLV